MHSSRVRFIAAAAATGLVLSSIFAIAVKDASGAGGTPGGGSTNQLKPDTYHGLKGKLDDFLKEPMQPSDISFALLLHPGGSITDADAEILMRYTIGCALGDGEELGYPLGIGTYKFKGDGLLTPPTGVKSPPWERVDVRWPGPGPTSLQRRSDIHTCLITRMNYFGQKVPIFLSGPHVTPRTPKAPLDRDDPKAYPYREAVWLATVTPNGIQVDVWPFNETLKLHCLDANGKSFDPKAIKTRVCGNSTNCNVIVHAGATDLDDMCGAAGSASDPNGVWRCTLTTVPLNYQAAIQTRLGPCAWKLIYGGACTDPWADPGSPQPPAGFLKDPVTYCANPDNP